MKIEIGRKQYGKPDKFILVAETDFEISYLKEKMLKEENSCLRPGWGFENKLELEICQAAKPNETVGA